MTRTHNETVRANFDPRAQAYLESPTHSAGEDLTHLETLLRGRFVQDAPEVLDLGCGGGHVTYAAAPHAHRVTACDISEEMLRVVARAAQERGLGNVETRQGPAEAPPFADASFDVVASRYSAHHWRDVGLALREIRRVLKPGGVFWLSDVASPGSPLLDTHLQAVELLRDTSHVRDYAPAEWLRFAAEADLRVREARSFRLRLDFASWIARMATPEPLAAAIRALQRAMPEEVRAHFGLEPDGSFTVDGFILTAEKA